MAVRIEQIAPERVITPVDEQAAAIAGISRTDHELLTQTTIYHFDPYELSGTNDVVTSARAHCGMGEDPARGGTKIKNYSAYENPAAAAEEDTVVHATAMADKLGSMSEGGKTVIFSPSTASREVMTAQDAEILEYVARAKVEAGLADPKVMITAGDERSNNQLNNYRQGFRKAGSPHHEILVTGKDDFPARAPATGEGGAIGYRTRLLRLGIYEASVAIAGMGAAGAHFAAEAYDPGNWEDRPVELHIPAVGDINPKTRRPATLYTEHYDGLPITHDMINSIRYNPEDPDMQAENFYVLAALARKVSRKIGEDKLMLVDKDVLEFRKRDGSKVTSLVPASTSNVIHLGNVANLAADHVQELANHSLHTDILAGDILEQLHIDYDDGVYMNKGGGFMSGQETERDLARHELKGDFKQPSVDYYNALLRREMITTVNEVYDIADKFDIPKTMAVRVRSLAQRAIKHGMTVDDSVRDLITA